MYTESTIDVIVSEIRQITLNVKEFTLMGMDKSILPAVSSGAHITTYVNDVNNTISRPYSIVEHKHNTYKIAIRLSEHSHGGSIYWHSHIKIGDQLKISYPKNNFPLSFKAKHHVLYAAGIGITPFLSMIKELKDKKQSFELHYAAPSKELCAYYDFINENIRESRFYFSNDITSNRINGSTLFEHSIGTHVYFCGPERFNKQLIEIANRIGYPKSSIHEEYFSPPKLKNTKQFYVKLKSGKKLIIPNEKSLLEVLLEEGINVPFSCRVGRCGTCELKVLDGIIEHRDQCLSEEQKDNQNSIITCVSRAISDQLILDC